jgi:hypothetical protein
MTSGFVNQIYSFMHFCRILTLIYQIWNHSLKITIKALLYGAKFLAPLQDK